MKLLCATSIAAALASGAAATARASSSTVALFEYGGGADDGGDGAYQYVRLAGARYRESVAPRGQRGVFALAMTHNDAILRTAHPPPSKVMHRVHVVAPEPTQLRAVPIRTAATVLERAAYVAPVDHTLSAAAMLSALPRPASTSLPSPPGVGGDGGGDLRAWVEVDGRRVGDAMPGRHGHFALHIAAIPLPAGAHTVALVAQASSQDRWCSCPPAGDGFVSGRHLLAWYEPARRERAMADASPRVAAADAVSAAVVPRKEGAPLSALHVACAPRRAQTRIHRAH